MSRYTQRTIADPYKRGTELGAQRTYVGMHSVRLLYLKNVAKNLGAQPTYVGTNSTRWLTLKKHGTDLGAQRTYVGAHSTRWLTLKNLAQTWEHSVLT